MLLEELRKFLRMAWRGGVGSVGVAVELGDFELSCGGSNVAEGASPGCRLEY